jgi:serine/threonine protein phosphatase PrpC
MTPARAWKIGTATDRGRERPVNEDRIWADEDRGAFLVVDGLGGHAAGELAAETAMEAIVREIERADRDDLLQDAEETIRLAITRANNEIFQLAAANEEYRGMACVLTLALAREDRVFVGHVGDSRLYLVWNGNVRKLTSDHSPVGEREDGGEITEREAMDHPRRNEIFRDVGSKLREPEEPGFIELKAFPFRSDAAFLLCSDGLSDLLTSAEIRDIVERYDGDAQATALDLVAAANAAGGKDNISVVFVAGQDFWGADSKTLLESRARHAITRMRKPRAERWRAVRRAVIWFLIGAVLGVALWVVLERVTPHLLHLESTRTSAAELHH